MIYPTRTNLLLLKEKIVAIHKSIGILKARRLALIKEFLETVKPFVKSREEIRNLYGQAIKRLSLAIPREGEVTIHSLNFVTKRELSLDVKEESIWGLKYKDVEVRGNIIRKIEERGYDYHFTDSLVEETIEHFEKIVEEMVKIAKLEGKIKRLSLEIEKTSKKIKILEERKLPETKRDLSAVNLYLNEREREAHYRLKIFKKRSSS